MTLALRAVFFAALVVPVAFAQDYEGNLDAANCSIIGGWAANANTPNTPIDVDIYDGSTYITTVLANAYRSDLGFVDYYHAFTITTPASLLNNAYHYIIAKYGGTNLQLGSSDIPLYCTAGATGYQYYYSDTFSTINSTAWYQNGSITTGSGGLTSSSSSGGSVISKAAVPDGTSQYEVKATLTLNAPTQSGEAYALYLRGTSNALSGPAASGTYYAFELQNPTFSGSACNASWALYRTVNGSVTALGTGSYPCNNGMTIRLIYTINSWIICYINNVPLIWTSDGTIGTGQPGVGVRSAAAANGIARVDLGPLDRVAPQPFQAPITSSAFPTRIDMEWTGVADNPNGIGTGFYDILRNSVAITLLQPKWSTFSDNSVAASTTYTYTIYAFDYHLNSVTTTFTATTPPTGAIDPREVGVRPLGSYWGGAGEQIDMRSGNLNYTLPLLKVQGRGGWGVGFNLSYNSQNWRQDPSGVWQLGRDIGYGYGWRLQAGSVTPVFANYWAVDHWLYIDSTGAEYRLDQNNGGIWSSEQGIYVYLDSNVGPTLHFPDGSFWTLGDLSAGSEEDAGTYYPSLMEDSNGNQVIINYNAGVSATWTNSSSRIATIEDVRGNGRTDYTFTYNTDTIPHLTGITNYIGTPENYSLAYTASSALISPFNSQNFGTFRFLQSATVTGPNMTTNFAYDTSGGGTSGTGELLEMTTPYGGHLRWAYTQYTLSGSRTFREIQYRYLLMCASSMAAYCSTNGGTEMQYQIARDGGDSSRNVHLYSWLIDYAANAAKVWYFQTDTTQFYGGLQTSYTEQTYPSPNTQLFHQGFTWSQAPTSLNPYIGSTLTTLDPGQSYQAQKQTAQTLDQYGNLLTMQVYDFGNLTTPARYYVNTYLTNNSNYTSRYIYNRLLTSTVATGATCSTAPLCTTLVSNGYDGSTPANLSGLQEHDSAYSSSFIYRGNVTSSITPTTTKVIGYDIGGNVTSGLVNGLYTTVTSSSSTNFAAPSQMTTISLVSTSSWYASLFPNSISGPNNDTASFVFDGNGRPYQTTSPTGAITNYTYNDSASPPTKTATTNSHWVQTAMDGFGRTIQTLNTGASVVATHYDPCGCSPLGKMSQVSQPFAPNGSVYWTNYTYDASGRTTSVAIQETASVYSTTTYVYQGNTVTVTDPAGKTKTFTMDAFGNLTTVVETDPTLGQVSTNYTYDILNHLIQVSMPRGSNTQTRTFNYVPSGTSTVGGFLLGATNPEYGTVTYTYNSNALLASKTDAKGQAFTYSYDSYNRLYQILVGGVVLRTFMYDTNTLDSTYTSYGAGRLVAVQNAGYSTNLGPSIQQAQFTEMYSYTQAGQPNGKRLQINETLPAYPYPVLTYNLNASYTYDNEGKMTSVSYPNAGPTYTYSFDSMSRPIGLTDQNNYAAVSGVQYGGSCALANQLSSMSYFGVTESRCYNTRMQLTNVTVAGQLNMTYNYPSGTNNGKISSQTDAISGETVTYAYDSLNRLLSASGSGWTDTYAYDGFGNLTTKTPTGGAPQLSVGVNPANNQVVGQNYDANGNQTSYNSIGLIYDAENRLLSATGLTDYLHDSQNKRIWKGTFSGGSMVAQEVYFFGVNGQKLGTYSVSVSGSQLIVTTTQTAVFFGGKRVAVNGAAFVPDRLGSNTAGKYFPYGEDRGTPIANDQVKYATYTRDSATGLDYADQRYYSNQFGRFMTPDPYDATATSPSDASTPPSWNRYAYVQGDPINHTDRSGLNLDAEDCIDDPEACEGEDWGGMGGSGPLNPGGSPPTLPAKVINEENQLDGLQQAGIISGWGITPTGFDLALTPGEAAEIGAVCVAQPWVCAAAGAGLGIYVAYTYGPALIQAIETTYQKSKNQRENAQFQEAVRRYARQCGKNLDDDEQQRLHQAISGLGYGIQEIVDEAKALFGCPNPPTRGGGRPL